jgi:Aspartyl protease
VIFPIPGFQSKVPVPALLGQTVRYKPVIPITVTGPKNQEARQILVDTGADDIVFPEALAARLGVDLSSAIPGSGHGIGAAQPVPVLFAPVILQLSDQQETYRWRALVGFTKASLRFAILGIAGGLEHFLTTFDFASHEMLLIALNTLPTTQDAAP